MITRESFEQALEERQTKPVRDKLKEGKVAIAGLGGLGSNVALMLARTGIKELFLVDFDVVDVSNLNRQAYTIDQLGQEKTKAMVELIKKANPWIAVKTYQGKVTKDNVKDLFSQYSIVCEAFDQPDVKAMLVNTLLEEVPDSYIISGNGMAGSKSSNLIKTKKVFDRLYVCGDGESEVSKDVSLTSARVSICAGHEANLAIQLILGEVEVPL